MNVVEQMEHAQASAKEKRKKQKIHMKEHADHFTAIANGLITIQEWIIDIRFDGTTSMDLKVAGDHNVLKGAWAALRKIGYEPSERLKETKITGVCVWFYKTGWPTIWFSFSSTKCTRKKVGTKMVEQPIFETVCE